MATASALHTLINPLKSRPYKQYCTTVFILLKAEATLIGSCPQGGDRLGGDQWKTWDHYRSVEEVQGGSAYLPAADWLREQISVTKLSVVRSLYEDKNMSLNRQAKRSLQDNVKQETRTKTGLYIDKMKNRYSSSRSQLLPSRSSTSSPMRGHKKEELKMSKK